MSLFIVCTCKKELGQMLNCTIRKNKPLLLEQAVVFKKIISVFWNLICARISVCGFHKYLHCAISSPKKFVFLSVFNFFTVVLYFSFFLPENKTSGFDLSLYFFKQWKQSWLCWTSGWVSVAQLFFMILTFTGWFVQQLTFLQAEKSSNGSSLSAERAAKVVWE